MHAMRWWLAACLGAVCIVDSRSSPPCEIPLGHREGEMVRAPREPKPGQMTCQKWGSVEIVTRRCETRYCCVPECTCLGDVHTNSSACSGSFVELACFVEHTEIRPHQIECCRGFALNSERMCIDIDECLTDPCEQGCHNFNGGFKCYCFQGYQLSSDGRTCLDDPTCEHRCAHRCAKVDGRYRCTCRANYVLGEDGARCHPVSKCADGHDCVHQCRDTETGIKCSCRSGYRLNKRGSGCEDIDECHETSDTCHHECVNTDGSFRCYCDFGFRLKVSDGRSCIPDASCGGQCDHVCTLVHNRYRCACRERHKLADDHVTCQSIDVIFSNSSYLSNDAMTSIRPQFIIVTNTTTLASPAAHVVPVLAVYICAHAVWECLCRSFLFVEA